LIVITHTRSTYVLVALATFWSCGAIGATPWETYLAIPSPEHAKLVTEPIYSNAEPNGTNGPSRLEQDFLVLGEQIRAGDAEAFDLGLRLREAAAVDGALGEFLNFTISDFLRIRPAEFLSGLSIYGTQKCVEAVYTNPDIFADRFPAQIYEFNRRLEAIAALRSQRLVKVRDLCIQALRSEISTAKSHFDAQ
jgi:hypothetical protein